MSNYANLKSAIQSAIKTNGNNEITGQLLQNELLAMITTLGYGYQFMGVASPNTVPGTPDAKVFYIAYTPGTYTNFNGISVTGLCVLKYATGWVKEDIPVSGGTVFSTEPDDLTLVSGTPNKLKFADRPYNSTTPNGLGYKILRKDLTFAEQVTDTNTIYEIRYPFNLNNASITIPAGSVLRFNGGKITGGSINFNGCSIEKNDADNLFENITAFSGSFSGYFTPENVSYGLSGDCFSALLTFLKSGHYLLKVNKMTLTSDTDLHGVWLDADIIEINGHTLKLGGWNNNVKDGNLLPYKSQNQRIGIVSTNGTYNNGRVIVGECYGYELHIDLLVGSKLEFLIEENNKGIAYSSFYFNTVSRIELSAESGITGGWINTNRFVLNRCGSFVVKSSLLQFTNNTINMGCFEGAFNIRLERGYSNTFESIRGESSSSARGEVNFGELTSSNVIELMFYPQVKIYDYGRSNIIKNNGFYDYRMLDKANISLQDVKKGATSRILGMSLSQDGTYLVPSNSYDVIPGFETALARYYQTGFIPYKKRMTILAILDVLSKNASGLGLAYELYDENFNPISVTNAGGTNVPLAKLLTTNGAYTSLISGTYFNAYAMRSNYRPGDAHTVDNNYLVFQFDDSSALSAIEEGDETVASTLDQVKYITISVVGNTYYHTFDSQILSVGVSIYEPGIKARFFNSDVE